MDRKELHEHLSDATEGLVKSILGEPTMRHLNRVFLPNRDAIVKAVGLMRQIIYPGYFGQENLTSENARQRMGELVKDLADVLYEQVRCCLRYKQQIAGNAAETEKSAECDTQAAGIVAAFLDRLPEMREILAMDVQAAYDSDPAAQSIDETIFCYPGLFAITVQRLAHEFYELQVPLLPRIMTEFAHGLTGIDIHPGARLGRRFFIDHGTGVVIGETTEIGENVKIYQGVTLGAVAPAFGQLLRGRKRHPTIKDDVVIYSGATILGGDTEIGEGCTIGGNVFITSSVPAHNIVTTESPKLQYRERRGKNKGGRSDFQI